jgi:hypothetical protein
MFFTWKYIKIILILFFLNYILISNKKNNYKTITPDNLIYKTDISANFCLINSISIGLFEIRNAWAWSIPLRGAFEYWHVTLPYLSLKKIKKLWIPEENIPKIITCWMTSPSPRGFQNQIKNKKYLRRACLRVS